MVKRMGRPAAREDVAGADGAFYVCTSRRKAGLVGLEEGR